MSIEHLSSPGGEPRRKSDAFFEAMGNMACGAFGMCIPLSVLVRLQTQAEAYEATKRAAAEQAIATPPVVAPEPVARPKSRRREAEDPRPWFTEDHPDWDDVARLKLAGDQDDIVAMIVDAPLGPQEA